MPIDVPFISSTRALTISPIVVAIWPGVKDRVVAVITSKPVLAGVTVIAGFIFGVSTVWGVDYFFQKKLAQLVTARQYDSNYCHQAFRGERLSKIDQPSPAEKNLKFRLKTIFGITISALLFSGGMALATWKTYGKYNYFNFFSLAVGGIGFALGAQFFENYNKNSEHKKGEFIQRIKIDGHVDLGWQLDLSYYCKYLRYLNLMQQGKEFYETFKRYDTPCHTLVLRGCGLTNTDLKSLKEGDWFSLFPHVNISDNPELTAIGLKWVGEGGAEKLISLDLSRTDLTDNDLIQMAASGYFNNLKTLIVRDNSQLTGKGLARIGESGFEKLEMLDISGNSQVLGKGLDEWIGKEGFKNLKALGLSHSNITEYDLQQMIDRTEWFKNLQGLDLDYSAILQKFPPNISQMTQLSVRTVNLDYSGHYRHFDREGLFFRNYSKKFEFTSEFMDLIRAHKVVTHSK